MIAHGFFLFFPMIPAIIFIKMDDTLYNCVVYFCLNENSVHLIKTKVLPSCRGKEGGSPFMKPDNDSYGEAPRAWKEITFLRLQLKQRVGK